MYDFDNLVHYIVGFSKIPDKDGDFLEEVVYDFAKPVPLSFLQDLFGIPRDYPDEGVRYMLDCFHIHEKEAKALQPFVNEKLDLEKYLFSLHCADIESHNEANADRMKVKVKLRHEDLVRFIEAFPHEPDVNGELWSVRFELQKPISIEFLNELFHVDPNDDEIFWGDELNEEQAKALQPYFNEKLDLMRYDLYLDAKRKPVDDKK